MIRIVLLLFHYHCLNQSSKRHSKNEGYLRLCYIRQNIKKQCYWKCNNTGCIKHPALLLFREHIQKYKFLLILNRKINLRKSRSRQTPAHLRLPQKYLLFLLFRQHPRYPHLPQPEFHFPEFLSGLLPVPPQV